MSLEVVSHPVEIRKALFPICIGVFIAMRTGDGFEEEEQADPRETYIPLSLKILTITSDGIVGADKQII